MFTPESHQQYQDEKNHLQTVTIIIYLIIFVFGFLANILVMYVIIRLREYQNSVFQWYVLQLAIADTLFLLSIPFQVSQDIRGAWIYPDWMCTVKESMTFINYFASILILTVMSINRYVAICHPLSSLQRTLKESKYIILIGVFIWISSLALTTPITLYSTPDGFSPKCKCKIAFPVEINATEICLLKNKTEDEINQCVENENEKKHSRCIDWNSQSNLNSGSGLNLTMNGTLDNNRYLNQNGYTDNTMPYTETSNDSNSNGDEITAYPGCHYIKAPLLWNVYIIITFLLFFVMPSLITAVAYGLIAKKLRQTPPSTEFRHNSDRNQHVIDKRKRVTITCAALVSCFIICWLPFYAVHLAKIVIIQTSTPILCNILSIAGTTLAYLNSAINPYLYTFLSKGCCHRLKSLRSTPEGQWITNALPGSSKSVKSTERKTLQTNINLESNKQDISQPMLKGSS